MQSRAYLQVCFCKLPRQFKEADTQTCCLSLNSVISGNWWSPTVIIAWSSLLNNTHYTFAEFFRKQSSLAPQGTKPTNQPTSLKPTTRVSIELQKKNVEGTASLPNPHPENTCFFSRPALEDLVRTNKRHIHTKHTYGALGSSHQAWDICGFLRMPACSSN